MKLEAGDVEGVFVVDEVGVWVYIMYIGNGFWCWKEGVN
jgi:hypothetical protein